MLRPKYNKEDFPHWTNISIRFRDLDPLNHVNNAIFCTYYEEARINFIQDVPAFTGQLQNGYSFVLANINIDFVLPVEYPAGVLIGTGIKKLGNSSITSYQAIYTAQEKKLVSVAEAHGVWFDLEEQSPSRLPRIPETGDYFFPDDFFE